MKYLYGYDSKENSYQVDNYPWGFRLRTKVRYWVETKKGFGQKFYKQTMNPKNGEWCKEKGGVYFPVVIMGLNDEGHVTHTGLSEYDQIETIEKFAKEHKGKLTEYQESALNMLRARQKAWEGVEVKFVNASGWNDEQFEENRKKKDEAKKYLQVRARNEFIKLEESKVG
jgi:hypothetical protein